MSLLFIRQSYNSFKELSRPFGHAGPCAARRVCVIIGMMREFFGVFVDATIHNMRAYESPGARAYWVWLYCGNEALECQGIGNHERDEQSQHVYVHDVNSEEMGVPAQQFVLGPITPTTWSHIHYCAQIELWNYLPHVANILAAVPQVVIPEIISRPTFKIIRQLTII